MRTEGLEFKSSTVYEKERGNVKFLFNCPNFLKTSKFCEI